MPPRFQDYVASLNNKQTYDIQQQQAMQAAQAAQGGHQPSAQQSVMASDPFSVERYRHVSAPDVPVQYGGGIAEALLNDSEVPESIRKEHWMVFHKDNTLTFLDPDRKQSKLLNFDIMKIDALNSMPYYDYTFDVEMKWGILRNVFETKLDRALGHAGGQNIKNERIVLQSQFSEQRQISEQSNGNMMQGSFFKRLLGRR